MADNRICLNADIGELPGDKGRALDRAILDMVSRCSIACGGHAGDDESIEATLKAAEARNVIVGAHPSYPDRSSFGRLTMNMARSELTSCITSQCRKLMAIAREKSIAVDHLKPHGALYNDAAKDEDLADVIVGICIQLDIPTLIGPPNSKLAKVAEYNQLNFLAEGFADRTYESDGSLSQRELPGAVIDNDAETVGQALQIATSRQVTARGGQVIDLNVDTLCLHSDTPGAVSTAFAVRQALLAHGVKIESSTST